MNVRRRPSSTSTPASRWSLAAACVALTVSAAACGSDNNPNPGNPTPPDTPTVTAVAPNSGSTLGGTDVTVTGTRFLDGAIVTIGGTAATDIRVQGATTLVAKTPQHAAGAVDVTVTVGGRAGTLRNGFTYTAPSQQTNQPPAIRSIRGQGSRRNMPANFADLGEEITITATVEDAETQPDQLTYEWSAPGGGTFSGTGASVKWKAPDGGSAREVELKLIVVEKYQGVDGSGLPVQRENRTEGTLKIAVHNSRSEVSDMAHTFLVDFSQQRLSPDQVIRNFTSSCRGTDDELGDVQRNQAQKVINTYRVDPPSVDVNFGGTCRDRGRGGDACAYVNVEWRSTDKASGRTETARGIDQVAAVYQGGRWWLCSSDFMGTTTNPIRPFLGATATAGQ